MILYELKCSNGHHFEAWFKDSTAYDRQEKRGEVACPICSDISVKAPMAPAVSTSRKNDNRVRQPVPPMEDRAAEVARKFFRPPARCKSMSKKIAITSATNLLKKRGPYITGKLKKGEFMAKPPSTRLRIF